ncbi:para-aminobenzoate synthetase / 4-amino-4-deoxychorismate lyase [Devosia lucknowensis]|uniref:Probable branched-chain-amino-acid aminotransferase n=1 Tax=Devosia lucknowensis TaxID=1096929 RepID=A0A1Y6GCZ8_9HYPH|nr:aminodeoxychorismate synthase component I [Devosia lucknowensis]SMQ85949.1 para-aminobenzoate synthetase / 4-amino-4-deoxychorismate lyase [Devosia lucknowensis]
MITTGTVLLHDNLGTGGQNLLFTAPREVLVAHTADQAHAALARLEAAGREGLWAAGYLAYELGFLFEERLARLLPPRSEMPLLWLGLYDAPRQLSGQDVDRLLSGAPEGRAAAVAPDLDFDAYRAAFDRVEALIAAGDTYQVNLTLRAGFTLEGDPLGLYRTLAASQPVAYGAYIHAGDHHVLSRSPELFVSGTGDILRARPMKGTMGRGRTLAEDEAGRAALAADPKNRAENLMIVDLLRNDLGRIAETGSVRVTDLFTVETYRSLHTMTSGIEARRKRGVGIGEVLANLFPCGSITGAPKLRAMEIIHAVEAGPRGLYTGSIGYVAPSGDFSFNVAIRTAVIDAGGRGTIGIGGGIVADSTARSEYDEALLKLTFLSDPAPPVTLIETMLWTPQHRYVLLERHIERLIASARYFRIPLDLGAISTALQDLQAGFESDMRVRLTVSAEAGHALTSTPLPPTPPVMRFVIAPERVTSTNLWLAHKTTNRQMLDAARQRAMESQGVDEVVFLNERNELTEGSYMSLFVGNGDGVFRTPPLTAGLLPGTLRADLIASGAAQEQVLTLDDLRQAGSDIYLGNSVRGVVPAVWVKTEDPA